MIGATTGFVIGITSAGSGTVIAILLIAVYRLAPKRVVGTDVFHAAILLWAAGIAHWVGGNVDFVLAGNILIGSIPGVVIGAALSDRAPQGFIRTALGVVLIGSGIVTIQKGDPTVWPIAAAVAAIGLALVLAAPHWLNRRRERDGQRMQAARPRRTAETGGATAPRTDAGDDRLSGPPAGRPARRPPRGRPALPRVGRWAKRPTERTSLACGVRDCHDARGRSTEGQGRTV